MNPRHSTIERLAGARKTIDGVKAPLLGASVRGERVARERRAADAERDARRKVAALLGPSTPGADERDDVETVAPLFGGLASWGAGW